MIRKFCIFIGITIIAIVLALVIWSYARADVKPQEFLKWEIVEMSPYPEGEGLFQALLMNPDTEHPIKLIYAIWFPKVDKKGVVQSIFVLAYFYEKDGVKYTFVYNKYTKKYVCKSPLSI